MKRRTWLWVLVTLLPTVALAQYGSDMTVSGFLEATWQSEYLWRGFDVFGNQSAMQYTGNIELDGTGFGLQVQGHYANGGGLVAATRWDYNPYYKGAVFKDEAYMLAYQLGYIWFNYPRMSSETADLQEIHGVVAMPKITGIKGLVPAYVLVKLWQAHGFDSGSRVGTANGFAHIFMLDYSFDLPGLIPESPKQPVRIHSELVYNDGVDPRGLVDMDHEWTNLVIGAATDFDIGYDITITPAVNYQFSFEEKVNDDDEFWVTLGAKWSF